MKMGQVGHGGYKMSCACQMGTITNGSQHVFAGSSNKWYVADMLGMGEGERETDECHRMKT